MKIINFSPPSEIPAEKQEFVKQFQALIDHLDSRDLPAEVVETINGKIEGLNSFSGSSAALLKKSKIIRKQILDLLQKRLGLVPENYHTTLWMALGMSAFGLPLGIVVSTLSGSAAFIGIGLMFGVAGGLAIGTSLDKKARAENKVLNVKL